MKKFSIVIAIVLCIVLSACLFAACQSHEHNFDEWGYDESNHWTVCSEDGEKNESSVVPHFDNDKDHKCDHCHVVMSECADNDKNHKCDVCGKTLDNGCIDDDNDHFCDFCGAQLSLCNDSDNDHKCDKCSKVISKCLDDNKDHKCDICGKESECVDSNKDHKCDVCNEVLSECSDSNKDHKCDVCSADMGEHKADEGSHNCDYCGEAVSECSDSNNDYLCDICGKEIVPDDHEHQFVFDPKLENDLPPTSSKDGYCHLSCSVEGCGLERVVDLKFLNIDVPVSVTAAPNEYVYFFMVNSHTEDIEVPEKAAFVIGEGTTLEYLTYRTSDPDSWTYVVECLNEELTNGTYTFADGPSAILLRACASDGNISFEMKSPQGSSSSNPIVMEKGRLYEGSVEKDLYYKYTASQDEELELYNGNGTYLHGASSYIYTYNIINLNANESISFYISWSSYSIKISDKDPNKSYQGYTPDDPIIMDSDTLVVDNELSGSYFYKYVVPEDGRMSIMFNDETVDAIFDSWGSLPIQVIDSNGQFYFQLPYLSKDDVIIINIGGSYENGFKLSVDFTPLIAVDNKFIVTDSNGDPMANITVSLLDADEIKYSGNTAADGSVVFNYIPASYDVQLSGFDADIYSYKPISVSWDAGDPKTDLGQEYTIKLISLVSRNVFVKFDDVVLPGVEVVLYTSRLRDGSLSGEIARATTDENGKAVLSYMMPEQVSSLYIGLENLNPKYTFGSLRVTKDNLSDATVSVSEAPKYTVSVVIPDGMDIDFADLSISCSYTVYRIYDDPKTEVIAEGKLSADGKFEFYYSLNDMSDIDIVVSGLPFDVDGVGVIVYGKYSGEVTLKKATLTALNVGENEIKLDRDEETPQWPSIKYVFTAEKDGKYTIALDDKIGFAFVKDSKGNLVLSQNFDMLSYTFNASQGDNVFFVASSNNDEAHSHSFILTITEYVAPVLPTLNSGENKITVTPSEDPVSYIFTSEEGGIYTITLVDQEGFAVVFCGEDSFDALMSCPEEPEMERLTYSFSLGAGDSIIIQFASENENLESHEFVLNIEKSQLATSLALSNNLVKGTYLGTTLTFTAEEQGNYIIYSFDENYCVKFDEELIRTPYRFSLEAGGSIDFCFLTADRSDSDTYVVVIEKLS